MTNNNTWSKFRILVANNCNYKCPFCHNEGQEKPQKANLMSKENFMDLVDILSTGPIDELNLSGGEPFLNKNIVEMIEYADKRLACDISCATNFSLINSKQIERLSKTRVKLNIQFPYVNEKAFHQSTGNGNLTTILQNIDLARNFGLNIGLNTVIQTENQEDYEHIIKFAIERELPLKLLPQIGGNNSKKYKDFIFPILNRYSVDYVDKGCGALRWILKKGEHSTSVLYIDSPCFYGDIETCKKFAEIRIHPDLTAQTCIMKESSEQLYLNKGPQYVINQLQSLWKNFTTC